MTANVPATVYLGGESRGDTPFKDAKLPAGSYSLRLVPHDTTLLPYETSLKLESGVSTAITRNLTAAEPDSSGFTLTLTEEVNGKTYLSIITDPDAVNIYLDGAPRGFTPLSKIEVAPGSHSVRLTSPGYVEQTLSVNAVKSFNLISNVKLAGQTINLTTPSSSPSASPATSAQPDRSPQPSSSAALPSVSMERPYVTVNDSPDITSAGGLNVRKDPSASSDALGKAKIGEKLKYLDETTPAGWHKVEFEGSIGYVSGKYVTLTK